MKVVIQRWKQMWKNIWTIGILNRKEPATVDHELLAGIIFDLLQVSLHYIIWWVAFVNVFYEIDSIFRINVKCVSENKQHTVAYVLASFIKERKKVFITKNLVRVHQKPHLA